MYTGKFKELDEQNRELLQIQSTVMCKYAEILQDRLKIIKE